MSENTHLQRFIEAAKKVGAEVVELDDLAAAAKYVAGKSSGRTLIPKTPLSEKYNLRELFAETGVDVFTGSFRDAGQTPDGGVTFCNFAMADTGTVVLNSTDEEIRLATTLPEVHYVIVDPSKIMEDNLAAAKPMSAMHTGSDPCFVAYITGPSRTADIERVLTIGCHGPRELHILLVPSVSSEIMEM